MAEMRQSDAAFEPIVPGAVTPTGQTEYDQRLERWRWMCLVRALRVALTGRMIVPAAGGVFLTVLGWWLLAWVFGGSDDPWIVTHLAGYRSCPFASHAVNGELPDLANPPPGPWAPPFIENPMFASPEIGRYPRIPLEGAWGQLSAPVRQLFDDQLSYVGLAFLLLCGLWVVAVWALVGGALVRMAAAHLTREEKLSWGKAFGHAASKWQSYFAAPLMPLLGIMIMTLPMALVALLMRTNVGLLVVGIVWPLYLLAGVLMTIFLIGLMFGWPLMWAAIGTEASDSFDALSRAYSYVYQRALKFLLYVLIATVLGAVGGIFVYGFATAVVYLAHWASSWGAGVPWSELTARSAWGTKLIEFWDGVVWLCALGFVYSYFWSASVGIYLLLRYDVDGTEMDEMHVDDEHEPFGLPPLKRDEAGVPDVADEAPPGETNGNAAATREKAPESTGHGTGLA